VSYKTFTLLNLITNSLLQNCELSAQSTENELVIHDF